MYLHLSTSNISDMYNSSDLRQLDCLKADILLQNITLQDDITAESLEIMVMNEQQLEIIAELRQAALN